MLRLIAGPNGADPLAREIAFGDLGEVSIDGLSVVTVEGSSLRGG